MLGGGLSRAAFPVVTQLFDFLIFIRTADRRMPDQSEQVSDSIVLRPASNADAPAVRELVFGILRGYGLAIDPETTDADLEDIDAHYWRRGGCFDVLVDTSAGRIIGSVGLCPIDRTSVELRKMYLDAGYRRRGLGQRLLAHALIEARARRFQRMFLETASVLKEAISLYERAGFRACPAEHCSARCDQTMELWLGQTASP